MKIGSKVIAILLLFIGLVAVNFLASAIPARIDTTAEKIYTLSPGTRSMLGKLEEPVKLELYYTRGAAGLPIYFKNYAARVEEMLRQYVSASRGRIELTVIDPKPDTPAEEKAGVAGLSGQPMPSGETVFFGLVATQADQQKVIPFFSPEREQFLEYDLSQLIYSVQLFDKRRLGFISGVPLRAEPDIMAMQSGRMPQSQTIIKEWEKTFAIVNIEGTATELPANLDCLAVIHPLDLSPKLQFAIDQFLLSGKPVFLALDPSSVQMRSRGGGMNMFGGLPPGLSSNLPALLGRWGFDFNPENIVGDLDNPTQVNAGSGQVVRYPMWPSLTRDCLNRSALPTSQLESLLFVEPGSIALKPGSTLTFTPLIQTSAQGGEVPMSMLQFTQLEDIGRQITISGRKTVAALVQGRFASAFPDGAPKDEKPADATAGKDEKKDDPAAPAPTEILKESKATCTLIVVCDTDWLFDDYSVRRLKFMGVEAAQPINDNLAFASNALEFLSGSQDLISIRGKGNSIRPFTVVRRMEAEAQLKYKQQLMALETRIQEVEAKLTELQGKKSEGTRLVASPEMTKTIEDFQKQQSVMRAERRQIRAALRENIEALQNRLLLANLLTMPLLVGAFGVWFFTRRGR
ncbi:MAG: Gldg family protein [Opitutaceae bacterium]|nr:Gldg family protein [Opitutaceae bacterium]